jgi:hypothetical protein
MLAQRNLRKYDENLPFDLFPAVLMPVQEGWCRHRGGIDRDGAGHVPVAYQFLGGPQWEILDSHFVYSETAIVSS